MNTVNCEYEPEVARTKRMANIKNKYKKEIYSNKHVRKIEEQSEKRNKSQLAKLSNRQYVEN